ncbi:MAG: C40 family peptidase, partial [Christensenellales bacterium]
IRYAASYLGTPYKSGGKGPKSFDCSGFTAYVLKHVGVNASTSSKAQGNNDKWPKVSYKNLKRGDLLIFTNTRLSSIGHVGIYLGDGRFIHCSSGSAMSVTISHLEGTYMKRFLWGRRWVAEADPSVLEQLGATETDGDTPPEAEEVEEEDVASDNADAVDVDGEEAITLD